MALIGLIGKRKGDGCIFDLVERNGMERKGKQLKHEEVG
jgi:hypothetical protein